MSKTTFPTIAGIWGANSLGLRISIETRDSIFDKNWETVQLQVGTESVSINLTPSFWRKCHELKHPAIGRWLKAQGLHPWKLNYPPEIKVQHLGGNQFEVLGPTK